MERVDGIGGFFFKAADAGALGRWHAEHLGVNESPTSYEAEVRTQQAGPTVFAPFGSEHGDSPHLGRGGWGLNFRVADEVHPNGRFAQLADPEGNAVQLWQPA